MSKVGTFLKKCWKSLAFRTIFLIWVVTIPLCILFILATWEAQNVILKQTENSLQLTADVYANQLNDRMSACNSYLYDLSVGSALFMRVRGQTGTADFYIARINLINEMYDKINSGGNADIYYFYSEKLDVGGLAKKGTYPQARKDALEEALFHIGYLEDHLKWSSVVLDDSVWLMRNTQSQNLQYGALINLDEITQAIAENLPYDSAQILWDSEQSTPEADRMTVTSDLRYMDLTLNILVDREEIIEMLPVIQRFGYIWALLIICLSVLMSFLLNLIVIRPLHILNRALVAFGEEDPATRINEQAGTSEFEKTYRYFNEMAENIYELKIDNYEKELAANEMDLKTLQLQIRPHFLLNTFNLMFSLTAIGETKSLQKLILYMTEYFRYLFQSGQQMAPFGQERILIEHYVEVSRMNYDGQVEYRSRISPEMDDVEVPPLLVHSFVENVFKHAMDPDKIMRIELCAAFRDGWVEITIADNGIGMPEEMVWQLNEDRSLGREDSMHVGWMNSVRRLRYFYGEEAALSVESVEGEGSKVFIRFPYLIRQEGDK